MQILKLSYALVALAFLSTSSSAQEKLPIKFGKVSVQDFDIKSPLIDSSTNAVVVADLGKTEFIANSNEHTFSLKFIAKKRIKIINKNGFDAATISIPLYVSNNGNEEKLADLDAFTYNIENGEVVKIKLPKASVFTEKYNKNHIIKKFTFPGIKEGSIIEYSYEITSDFFFNLQEWVFQGQYPVLWSQYEASIPEFYKYIILSQGYHPFLINKTDKVQRSFSFTEHVARETQTLANSNIARQSGINTFKIEGLVDNHLWVMKDVPALKEEPFTTTLNNAISKVEFQLNQVMFPNTAPKYYMDNWEKIASDLMQDNEFGVPIKKGNNWLNDDVKAVVNKESSEEEKAQKIFEYVRDNFTCNDRRGIYTTASLKDIVKNKSGSVADINMLLIAMLRTVNIDANPVILSTRSHGFTHEFYPLINRYNYVIAKVDINGYPIYLDATNPYLAYAVLPARVYNGQAREITNNLAIPIVFVADSLKEKSNTLVFINNLEKGGVEGFYSHELGTYESEAFRINMTKTKLDDFKKSLQQEYTEEVVLENIHVDSLKLLKEPVAVKFDFKLTSFGEEDIIYFSPMLGEVIKKNVFTAAERYYPVEMPYTIDKTYTLTMEIPKGYKVDELPKSVRSNFNDGEGMFEYLISADKEYINLRCRLVLNRANFLNEDYQTLREFYGYVIKKEAEQIVFKKIK